MFESGQFRSLVDTAANSNFEPKAGVLNTHMWWDRKKGVAGIIFMQHIPLADETALQIYGDFEQAVYASL
jgi:hypothetical protein